MNEIILGINSAYHEPSACIIKNGYIIAAVEEERFSRVKHGKPANLLNPHQIPDKSIEYCLKQAGIEAKDVDFIGYSFVPETRFEKNVGIDKEFVEGGAGSHSGEETFYYLNKAVPEKLSRMFGYDVTPKFKWITHHLCHASSAFFVSPFENAAILSVDGIGEYASIWMGQGKENKIEKIKAIYYPNSLGFLWTKMSRFLGFGEYGQWKVMGLTAYGNPETYYESFFDFVSFDEQGNFTVDGDVLQHRVDKFNKFEELFGQHRRGNDEILDRYKDIAAALQKITNEAMLCLSRYLYKETGSKNLAIAGGVGLNCVTNDYLSEKSPFEEIYIQPAANDAGTAVGACYYLWNQVLENKERYLQENVYLGPEYSNTEIESVLDTQDIEYSKHDNIQRTVAELLSNGEVVAWFQGRMEFGPRALGNRSILADPRRVDMAHYLNEKIKHREFFRPFAASVLEERTNDWFIIKKPLFSDKFMLFSRKVKNDKIGAIPAVTHYDNTCRIQTVSESDNPGYYQLIREFEKLTDVPMLLNTSFNDSEPIICSPQDAINTCIKSDIRWLAIDDFLVDLVNVSSVSFDNSTEGQQKTELINIQESKIKLEETPMQMIFRSR